MHCHNLNGYFRMHAAKHARFPTFLKSPPRPCRVAPVHSHRSAKIVVAGIKQETASAANTRLWESAIRAPAVACLSVAVLLATPACQAACTIEQALQHEASVSQQWTHTGQQANVLADLAAGEFGGISLFGNEDKEESQPFTLYGTNFKKYLIEKLNGEKVVARKRGFTVESCVAAMATSEETPEFQFLPTGEKVQAAGGVICKKSEGADLKPTCAASCSSACSAGLDKYAATSKDLTGYSLEPQDKERMLKSCQRHCSYECTKPGKAFDFVVTSRR